jgi:hypothetical protein
MDYGEYRYQVGLGRYPGSRYQDDDWDRQHYLMHVLHPRNRIWIMTIGATFFT